MNCGITGHRGALGQEFIKYNKKINFIKFQGDLTKKKQIEKWVKKNSFDVFVHFAAIVPTKFVEKFYLKSKKVNVLGTKYLIDALSKFQKKKLKWFFFASSSHVYKFQNKKIKETDKILPVTKYGKTKLEAEKMLLKRTENICIGRIFSFTHKTHSEDYLIPSLYNKIFLSRKKKIIFENLNHYRDFLDTSDICRAITKLMIKKKIGIYNVCSGKKTNLKDLAMFMAKKKKILYEFKKKEYKITKLIGNNDKLLSTGWKPNKNIEFVIKSYIREKNKNVSSNK